MSETDPEPQPVTDITNYVPNDQVPEYVSPDIAKAQAGGVVVFDSSPEQPEVEEN